MQISWRFTLNLSLDAPEFVDKINLHKSLSDDVGASMMTALDVKFTQSSLTFLLASKLKSVISALVNVHSRVRRVTTLNHRALSKRFHSGPLEKFSLVDISSEIQHSMSS